MAVATASAARLGIALGGGGPAATQGAPLVYIAAGHGEVGLWDIASGTCLQVRHLNEALRSIYEKCYHHHASFA
jgi:hypothetical protein